VCLLKIPLSLFACLVGKVFLKEVEEINCLLVQVWKVRLRNAFLASGYIPVHALDQHLNHLITGIRNWRQAIETGAWLGGLDGCIDELNLVHSSIYRYIHRSTQYILVHTSVCMHRSTSGAMRSLTMKGNVSISIFIRSPVILAFSLPSM
jgi:hypothetical protein